MAYQHGITVLISIHALREEGDAMMGAAYTADR